MTEHLPDRQRSIVLLLEALDDLFHAPKGVRFGGSSGSSGATGYEPCLRCGGSWLHGATTGRRYGYQRGTGWITDRFRRRLPCPECGGFVDEAGEPRPGSGRVGVDSGLKTAFRVVASEESSLPASVRRVERWACPVCLPLDPKATYGTGFDQGRGESCRACGGSGTVEHSPFTLVGADPDRIPDPVTVVERAIDWRDEQGSFHEVEVCLAELGRRERHLWRVVQQVHVVKLRSVEELDEREARWRLEGLARLEELVVSGGFVPLRVPGYLLMLDRERRRARARARGRWTDPRALAARDAEIRALFNSGELSVEELVRRFGVQRSTVYEAIHGGAA